MDLKTDRVRVPRKHVLCRWLSSFDDQTKNFLTVKTGDGGNLDKIAQTREHCYIRSFAPLSGEIFRKQK